MRTILVPVGGGESDAAVLAQALAVARAVAGHLEFLHIGVAAADAALHMPHLEFARGAALSHALDDLARRARSRRTAAEQHVRELCDRLDIALVEVPTSSPAVTARWREAQGDAASCLMFHARHNDLTVMARPGEADGLPPDRLETLLLGSGRPLLIVPEAARENTLGTIVLCWKETAEAAHALAASMPLLRKAQQAVVASVRESDGQSTCAVADLIGQLAWHGIAAQPHIVTPNGRSTFDALMQTAREYRADLLVMGGYGRRRSSEILFGGCTQSVLEGADLPILIAH